MVKGGIFDHMNDRIHIVLPKGFKQKLTDEAKRQKRSKSNLAMKYIIDGLAKEIKQ